MVVKLNVDASSLLLREREKQKFVFWMGQSAAVTDDELTNGQPVASARSRGNFFFCDQQLH